MKAREPAALVDTLRAVVRLCRLDAEARGDAGNLGDRRRAALAELPENVSAVYLALARAGRHPAAVPVSNGFCAGCHLRVPPQLANTLARAKQLIRCPHCQRILYDPQDLEPSRA